MKICLFTEELRSAECGVRSKEFRGTDPGIFSTAQARRQRSDQWSQDLAYPNPYYTARSQFY